MNRSQRIVAAVGCVCLAGVLHFGIPRHGRVEHELDIHDRRWLTSADSIVRALGPMYVATLPLLDSIPGMDMTGLNQRRLAVFEDPRVIAALGENPTISFVPKFIHEPNTIEVVLRYLSPMLLLFVALYVLLGARSHSAGHREYPEQH